MNERMVECFPFSHAIMQSFFQNYLFFVTSGLSGLCKRFLLF